MMTMMNLVRECRINNISEKAVWKAILKNRWSEEILKANSNCLNETQVAEVIHLTSQELNVTYIAHKWTPEEDLTLGTELYSVLYYCFGQFREAAQLSTFFESLLENHSLKTIVASTRHNIQPTAGDNIKDFTLVNNWYNKLDKRYNLSLGPIITALASMDQMKRLKKLDVPYLDDNNQNDKWRKQELDKVTSMSGNMNAGSSFTFSSSCKKVTKWQRQVIHPI